MTTDIQLGDRITFSATTREGRRKVTRKVNGFWHGNPTVRFFGWPNFVVGAFGDVIHSVER